MSSQEINTVSAQKVIPTERFVIRPLRQSDVGLLEQFAGDRRVAQMTRDIPHPLPPGATDAFVRRAASEHSDQHVWVIDASASGLGEVIGQIDLTPQGDGQSEIGYWVAPVAWNTGVASEAVQALCQANPLGDRTLFASVFQDNPASGRVVTQAGFDYIGDAEAFSVARAAPVPTWTYLRKMT